MKPYNRSYLINKINEYNKLISLGSIGSSKIINSKERKGYINGYMYDKNESLDLDILELHKSGDVCMKISPIEIESSYMFIKYASGKVGVVGLGLGYVVQELAKKKDVSEIIVYEKEKDIIDLYKLNFYEDSKIKIINKDAYKAKKEEFDFFYVDIYGYKLTREVVEDYKKFTKIHNIKEYLFWGLEHFLLSCKYEEIVWVYIPEIWMEISKSIFIALQNSNLLNNYKQLDEKLVSDILSEFKVIFDEGE